MYGENRKYRYLNYLSGNSGDDLFFDLQLKPVRDMNSLLEKLAMVEEREGQDIAQINPKRYPRILFEIIKSQRFSYFQKTYQQLLDYRDFVFQHGLIDIKYQFKGFESYTEATTSKELLAEFAQLQKEFHEDTIFYTANDLYYYLVEQVYASNIDNAQNNDYLQNETVISNDELTMLYILLHYHGIERDELCSINKRNSIQWISDKEALIYIKLNKYIIKGFTLQLLKKATKTTYVTFRRGRGFALQQLNDKYLFTYENDDIDSKEGFVKRSNKIANKFSKDCELAAINSPTLSSIYFQGALYRVCEHLHRDQIDFLDPHIVNLFKKYYYSDNTKNPTYHVELEVVNEVKSRYKYLTENNLWL